MKKIIFIFSFLLIANMSYSQIAASGAETCPLKIGEQLPDATVFDINSNPIKITEALDSKPTVLIFYRGGWCPYCTVHLAALQEKEGEFIEMGYQILAITPDSLDKIQETLDKKDLNYTILSDSSFELMSKMGIAYIDRKNRTLPVPSVYIIDSKGVVQFNYVNPNYKVRIAPELLLKAAELAVK
ncbi:MAG: peroxiredoxin family protein [Reichenbachiella sp.]